MVKLPIYLAENHSSCLSISWHGCSWLCGFYATCSTFVQKSPWTTKCWL